MGRCFCPRKLQFQKKIKYSGILLAIGLTIHNAPEGIAMGVGFLAASALGISMTIAIALHNIPEGISVSVPIYYATKSRKKAFWLSFFSGFAEILGALIGYFFLRAFFTDSVFGILFGGVAGIMVYISIDELYPTAREYGQGHIAIYGLIAGMAVMALSLLLFL